MDGGFSNDILIFVFGYIWVYNPKRIFELVLSHIFSLVFIFLMGRLGRGPWITSESKTSTGPLDTIVEKRYQEDLERKFQANWALEIFNA